MFIREAPVSPALALFHYLHLRAFAHETEDPEKVRVAMRHAVGVDAKDLDFEETEVEGSHKNRIRILEAEVRGAIEKQFFAALQRDDPQGYDSIRRHARERLDEHLNFYLRLDKQEAYLGRVKLAEGDDAITVRAKVKSFASKRSQAGLEEPLRQLEAFLSELDSKAQRFKNQRTVG